MCMHNKWIFLCGIKFLLLSVIFSAVINAQTQGLPDTLSLPRLGSTQSLNQSSAAVVADHFYQCLSTSVGFLASQPIIVSGAAYLEGFANKLEGNTAYSTYKKRIASRQEQLYFFDNEGVLHGFNTKTGVNTFAFIPTLESTASDQLAVYNYSHETYIDATPVAAEVYDGTQWRTILVGTLPARGKGLFVLDVTNPDAITVLWQLEVTKEKLKGLDVSLGYIPPPTVARLHTGQWAVVIGNGYSANGTDTGAAALYLFDVIDGSLIKGLPVQSNLAQANGLSAPRLADYDGDGIADYAYAGDLHGNLWRFDLLGDDVALKPSQSRYGAKTGSSMGFQVGYEGKPLFTATANDAHQPIIAAPSLVRHPTRKGYLVIFGTAQYFTADDKVNHRTFANSLYGVWDMHTKAETTYADTITRKQLTLQNISSETISINQSNSQQREARIISNNPVEWHTDFDPAQPVKQRGWYLDLQVGSQPNDELLVDNMSTLGSMLLLQTIVPNPDICAVESNRWLYALNPSTGGGLLHHAFTNQIANSGVVTAIKFGKKNGVSIRQSEQSFSVHTADDQELIVPPAESLGRQSWRMIHEP